MLFIVFSHINHTHVCLCYAKTKKNPKVKWKRNITSKVSTYNISNVVLHLFLVFISFVLLLLLYDSFQIHHISYYYYMCCEMFSFCFWFSLFLLFYLLHFEIAKSCEHSYYYVYMVAGKALRKKIEVNCNKKSIKMNKIWYKQESSRMQRKKIVKKKKATAYSLFSGKRRKFHGVARTCWNYDYVLINQIKLFSFQASNQYYVWTWNVCWMLWNANVIYWMSWKVFFRESKLYRN